jgi:hypothetical protein
MRVGTLQQSYEIISSGIKTTSSLRVRVWSTVVKFWSPLSVKDRLDSKINQIANLALVVAMPDQANSAMLHEEYVYYHVYPVNLACLIVGCVRSGGAYALGKSIKQLDASWYACQRH